MLRGSGYMRTRREALRSAATDHHGRRKHGAQGRIRTTDTRIFNPLLYQLSYLGFSPVWASGPTGMTGGAAPLGKRVGYSMGNRAVQRL